MANHEGPSTTEKIDTAESRPESSALRRLGYAAALASSLTAVAEASAAENGDDVSEYLKNTEACTNAATVQIMEGMQEDLDQNRIKQMLLQEMIDNVRSKFLDAGTDLEEQWRSKIEVYNDAKNLFEAERGQALMDLLNFVASCEDHVEAVDFFLKSGLDMEGKNKEEMEAEKVRVQTYIETARDIVDEYKN